MTRYLLKFMPLSFFSNYDSFNLCFNQSFFSHNVIMKLRGKLKEREKTNFIMNLR